MNRLARRARPRERFLLSAEVLVDSSQGLVVRLEDDPKGREARGVSVWLSPSIPLPLAVARLRALADEIDGA